MEKNYYLTKEQFETVKSAWRAMPVGSKTPSRHIIYNVLRNKSPDNGFCVKTKNIQGNDPWYAYNEARRLVNFMYGNKPKHIGHYGRIVLQYILDFKKEWGIEFPEDLLDRIGDKK